MAKTQAFPELHDLTRLNVAFEHVTSNVHRGEYLGHKLCARLIPDFDQTDDPKAWLNVSPFIKDIMPGGSAVRKTGTCEGLDDMDSPLPSKHPPAIWPILSQWSKLSCLSLDHWWKPSQLPPAIS